MTIRLADISRCFEGEIPSMLVTASADGWPNLGHLSQVFLLDEHHVAVSNQFFTKTVANLAANPLATLVAVDPDDFRSYRFLLRHERSETTGAMFDSMRRSIDAIAALTDMAGVFSLRAVEVFRVLEVSVVASPASDAG